jgi:hypothetical protein
MLFSENQQQGKDAHLNTLTQQSTRNPIQCNKKEKGIEFRKKN